MLQLNLLQPHLQHLSYHPSNKTLCTFKRFIPHFEPFSPTVAGTKLLPEHITHLKFTLSCSLLLIPLHLLCAQLLLSIFLHRIFYTTHLSVLLFLYLTKWNLFSLELYRYTRLNTCRKGHKYGLFTLMVQNLRTVSFRPPFHLLPDFSFTLPPSASVFTAERHALGLASDILFQECPPLSHLL